MTSQLSSSVSKGTTSTFNMSATALMRDLRQRVLVKSEPPSTQEQKRLVLRLAIDYGTTKLAAAWQIWNTADNTSLQGPYDVRFPSGEYKTANIAAYDNGKFLWGREVADLVAAGDLSEGKVVRLAKLAILPDDQTKPIMDTAMRKLMQAGKSLEDLIEDGLRAMIDFSVKDASKTLQGLHYNTADMPVELFLSVPQMWIPPANKVMTKAARRVGVPSCKLVYEPECAAVHAVITQLQPLGPVNNTGFLQIGDVIMVADLGGGTADFVSYELQSEVTDKGRVSLRTVQSPEGKLCGSHWVNNEFLNFLLAREPSPQLSLRLKGLGLDQDDFLANAAALFEREKIEFNNMKKHYKIAVDGRHGHEDESYSVRWDLDIMRTFFDIIIDQIIDAIDNNLLECPNTRVVMVPGGFGHCPYLLSQLRDRYEASGIHVLEPASSVYPNPVPRGALLRDRVDIEGRPSEGWWGTLQAQEFDPKKHPDGLLPGCQWLKRNATGKKTKRLRPPHDDELDLAVVLSDPVDEECDRVVLDRWVSLVKEGDIVDSLTPTTSTPVTVFRYEAKPAENEPFVLKVDIYWSRKRIADDAPARQRIDDDDERESVGCADLLNPGIYHWETASIVVEDHASRGWDVVTDRKGVECYKFWMSYALAFDGPNVSFVHAFFKADETPYDVRGRKKRNFKHKEFKPQGAHEIFAASHSPFVAAI